MIDERMMFLHHNAFIFFCESSPKQNEHWAISSEVSKMTTEPAFWFINNIGDKTQSLNAVNAVPRITDVWNITHTTRNGVPKCANCLCYSASLLLQDTDNWLFRLFWYLIKITAQENAKLLTSMLNSSIIK